MRGKAAVPVISGKDRHIAEILAIRNAVFAMPAGLSQPRYPHALPNRQDAGAGAESLHNAYDFVPGDDGIVDFG